MADAGSSAGDDPDLQLGLAADAVRGDLAAGRRPDLSALARRFPACAAELPGLADTLAALAADPPVLDDFRLLGEVGRGGMGVVYRAEQVSLGRTVAVKVLPRAAVLDPARVRRFRTEAAAAARLRHPNVVPVFAVGQAAGVPYYAMQWVDGRSLAAVVGDLRAGGGPFPAGGAAHHRAAAGWVAAAADALDHAHQAGVVHRDVKPANLLLDQTGHLWVADFGLALLRDAGDHTRTGESPGTPRYMSPEQAAGRRGVVDHRADVYGLGAVLYELLALRPAVTGDDPAEQVRQVLHDDPRPPRRLDPRVPYELETVALRALAKRPDDRYPTAADLAADLRRWLAGQPVAARRPGLAELGRRWVWRHRRAWRAAGVGSFVAAVGLAGAVVAVSRQRAEADRQRLVARQAVDDMYTAVAEQWLEDEAGLEPVQRDFLQKALAAYQGMAAERPGDPAAARRVAEALRRVGVIRHKFGAYAEAEAALRAALAADAVDPAAACDLGLLLVQVGRADEAADLAAAARRALPAGEEGDPPERLALRLQAETLAGRAAALLVREADAERAFRAAAAAGRQLAGQTGNPRHVARLLAAEDGLRGCLQRADPDSPELADLAWGLADRAEELAARPGGRRYRATLVRAHAGVGVWLQNVRAAPPAERIDRAEAGLRRTLGVARELAAEAADVPAHRYRLADVHYYLGVLLGRHRQRPGDGLAELRTAAGILGELADAGPDVIGVHQSLLNVHRLLAFGATLAPGADPSAAMREAAAYTRRTADRFPHLPDMQVRAAENWTVLGDLSLVGGRPAAGEESVREAARRLDRLAAELPEAGPVLARRVAAHRALGQVHLALGRHPEAARELQVAADGLAALRAKSPRDAAPHEQPVRRALQQLRAAAPAAPGPENRPPGVNLPPASGQ